MHRLSVSVLYLLFVLLSMHGELLSSRRRQFRRNVGAEKVFATMWKYPSLEDFLSRHSVERVDGEVWREAFKRYRTTEDTMRVLLTGVRLKEALERGYPHSALAQAARTGRNAVQIARGRWRFYRCHSRREGALGGQIAEAVESLDKGNGPELLSAVGVSPHIIAVACKIRARRDGEEIENDE